jgi:hypothetical protein
MKKQVVLWRKLNRFLSSPISGNKSTRAFETLELWGATALDEPYFSISVFCLFVCKWISWLPWMLVSLRVAEHTSSRDLVAQNRSPLRNFRKICAYLWVLSNNLQQKNFTNYIKKYYIIVIVIKVLCRNWNL